MELKPTSRPGSQATILNYNVLADIYEPEPAVPEPKENNIHLFFQPKFIFYFLSNILIMLYYMFYIPNFKVIGLSMINNDILISNIFALGSVSNFFARYFSGDFFQYFGLKRSFELCVYASLFNVAVMVLTDPSHPYIFNWIHILLRGLSGLIFLTMLNGLFVLYKKETALYLLRSMDMAFLFATLFGVIINYVLVFGTNYRYIHLLFLVTTASALGLFRAKNHLFTEEGKKN